MIPPELSAAIEALIAQLLPQSTWNNVLASEKPRSLCIHATSAMYEYYLAPDGTVYEKDLDSSRGPERVESVDTVRETYAQAAAKFPALAALAAIDPAALPTTFEDALRFPAHVVAAWDDSDPRGRTLVAFAVGHSGARRLASRTVAPEERDTLLDALGRDHPVGATLGSLVWHVDLVSGFELHDATGLRASYVRAFDDYAFVRSTRALELVAVDGTTTTIVSDVDPRVASRAGRDLANFVGRPHDDQGVPGANEPELALVRACRELAERVEAVASYKVRREPRVSAGPFGGAREVAVRLEEVGVAVEITSKRGTQHVVPLRAPADHDWLVTRLYLERPWIIRDIIRAVAEVA